MCPHIFSQNVGDRTLFGVLFDSACRSISHKVSIRFRVVVVVVVCCVVVVVFIYLPAFVM